MPHLVIRLINAVDLLGADFDGFSDPYCVLTIGNTSCKSKIIKHSLTPTWNEVFEFEIEKIDNETSLELHVIDYDTVGSDDSLGLCNVILNDLITGIEKVFWVKLEGGEMGENIMGKAKGSFFKSKSKSRRKDKDKEKEKEKSEQIDNRGKVQIGLTAVDFG